MEEKLVFQKAKFVINIGLANSNNSDEGETQYNSIHDEI